jgi:DNA-binding SARP family transcriptional activator/tetratricopeptide (TPR) repeat protein/DNA-binding XRE family transcriptional regulator
LDEVCEVWAMQQPLSTVGELLRGHRRRAGVTQQELARRAGISVRALRDIEQGRVRRPRSVRQLAAALRLPEADQRQLSGAVVAGGTSATDRVGISVLGPLRVWRGAADLEIRQSRLRCLLGLLAVQPGQLVPRAEIVDALWGQAPPDTCLELVHTYVARLRALLEPGRRPRAPAQLLVGVPGGYRLELDTGQLDAMRFDELAAMARQARRAADLQAAHGLFAQALALWRGAVLADLGFRLREQPAAVALSRRRLAVTLDFADNAIGLGRYEAAVAPLRELCRDEPLHEGVHARLMLALAGCGQQADALGLFAELRRRLIEELGIEPGAEVQDAHLRILRQQVPGPAGARAVAAPRPDRAPEDAGSAGARAGGLSTPAQLPADVAAFTGRTRELGELDRLLKPGADTTAVVISAIAGTAGVGKSALAIHAAHCAAQRFPEGQLYVNLQGATVGLRPLKPLEVLGRFLRALGVDGQDVPNDVDEAAAKFRSQIAGRRLLVVLDNARDAEQVRPLLPGSRSCAALITSREVLGSLAGTHWFRLDLLPQQEALDLLGRVVGQQRIAAEPQAATEVVRWCGRLPLALQIAGARLAARPGWLVRALAERLADATSRLEELRLGELAVRASFHVSVQVLDHSDDPLDHLAAGAFGLLSVPDGPDIGVAAAARLLDQPEATAERLLERLVDAQLLESPQRGRYQFHDLIRLHARQHAASRYQRTERLAALERLFGFYTATAWRTLALLRPGDQRLATADRRWIAGGLHFPDAEEALEWLEAERANLLAAVPQTAAISPAVPAALATELTRALFGFFYVHSHWSDWVQANQTALELARGTQDRATQANAHNDLGIVFERLGRYQEALDHHRQAFTIRRQLGDRRGQAASLGNLGNVHWRLGHYQEALDHYRQALVIERQLGNIRGQAASLGNIGFVYERLGRYQEALDYDRQALAIERQLGDRRGEADSLTNLGVVLCRMERYQEALDHHQQALVLFREFGDRYGQALCLTNLGVVLGRLGRYQEALGHHRQALIIRRELGDPYGQAEALRDSGDALLGLGSQQQAHTAWQEALAICEALKIPEADEIRKRLVAVPPDHG